MTSLVVSLPDNRLMEHVGELPGVEFVLWDLRSPAPRARFDLVVPPYLEGPRVLQALDGVEVGLVQSQSIGYDGVARFLPSGVRFANAATVHETSTAELAVGLAIAAQRRIPEAVRNAEHGRWLQKFSPSLADRRVLIVGYGGVSKAIEARVAPFETQITRVASTARRDENLAGQEVHVHGVDELPTLLEESEIVFIAVPLTDATRGLFDARMLAALPDGALLVNVARGAVVDTDALIAELQAGRIRAALDVVDPEPLPEGHPLWTCPGLLITPHLGGDTSAMLPRVVSLITRQVEHLRAGREPENVIAL